MANSPGRRRAALLRGCARLSLPVLAGAVLVVTPPASPVVAGPSADVILPVRSEAVAPAGQVTVRDLPAPAADERPAPKAYPAGVGPVADRGRPAEPSSQTVLTEEPGVSATTAGGPNMALITSTAALDSVCGCEPPDTTIGVGPSHAVEMVNLSGRIYNKNLIPTSTYSLTTFFGTPGIAMTAASYSDPKVYYDALSSRWFATILIHDVCGTTGRPACGTGTATRNSVVRLAVSTSNDPTGTWTRYSIDTDTTGVLLDQPKFGVSDDKFIVSHDNFGAAGYLGVRYTVARKSDLVAGTTVSLDRYGRDASKRWVVPARSLSSTTTQFATHASGSTLTVYRFTGIPGSGGSSLATNTMNISSLSTPPDAQQKGSTALIDTGNSNIQSVMWRSNTLWSAATESCTPSGDSTARACVRLLRVSTSSTPSLAAEHRIGSSGNYMFFPSIVTTGSGDAFVGYTLSGSSRYATAAVMYGQGGNFGASIPNNAFWAGSGPYNGGRWGDYSEIAVDPSNTDEVWTAQEYGATTTSASASWGTAIGIFTGVAPSITSMSPSSGTRSGGTTVNIYGREFGMGATLNWGGSSVSYTRVSTTQIRVTTPARPAGAISVNVTTTAGTSNSVTYTYT